MDFIDIQQEAARSLGFEDLQAQWLERYESEDFPGIVEQVWSEKFLVSGVERSLEEFYKHLHAFVRHKLRQVYQTQEGVEIEETGAIPANVLGNMWAQSWGNNSHTWLDILNMLIDKLVKAPASAYYELVMVFALFTTTHHHHPNFDKLFLSSLWSDLSM